MSHDLSKMAAAMAGTAWPVVNLRDLFLLFGLVDLRLEAYVFAPDFRPRFY